MIFCCHFCIFHVSLSKISIYVTTIVSVCDSIFLQTAYSFKRGFQPRQTFSCAVLQNPNCTLLNVDDAVRHSNADWLTSGPEQGKEKQQTSPWTGEAQKTPKNTAWKVKTAAAVDTFHWFFSTQFLFMFLYVWTSLFSGSLTDQQYQKQQWLTGSLTLPSSDKGHSLQVDGLKLPMHQQPLLN